MYKLLVAKTDANRPNSTSWSFLTNTDGTEYSTESKAEVAAKYRDQLSITPAGSLRAVEDLTVEIAVTVEDSIVTPEEEVEP